MDGWLWETLFQPWIRNFQKQDEWWCPAPAVETSSTSEISSKDGNRNLWKTLKAFFSRVINLLLTKLARDRTGRISALGLFCTDLAALGPYCQDLGPIFSQYGPRAWLIRYIYWPEVVAVRTERSEVRTATTEGQYSPVRPKQVRLVSGLLYGTLFLIVKCSFKNAL